QVFYFYDEAGERIDAIKYSDDSYQIRKDLLLKFCRVKGMCAVTYVDGTRYSEKELSTFVPQEQRRSFEGERYHYKTILTDDKYSSYEGVRSVAHVMGKRVILPPMG